MPSHIISAARFAIPNDQRRRVRACLLRQPLRLIQNVQIAGEKGLHVILVVRELNQIILGFNCCKQSVVPLAPIAAAIHYGHGPKITPAKEAADETSHSLDALNKTVTPAVNKSQLQETMELISRIEAGLARINGGIGGLSAKAAGLRSLGSIQRGSFTSSGVQGE